LLTWIGFMLLIKYWGCIQCMYHAAAYPMILFYLKPIKFEFQVEPRHGSHVD
jgi:hypothetical protein